ncbi:glycoside hydrolase family 13 protein [Thermothelomyces thermophilus ATCC 42464]|uniref:Glycoside hydrolase family 13 protein n=1 Tax=Thermothelomyces thermophilus (strain ATCC 42464 / BCRC 31852 / DSM 1799) TaxID=573729 RepID=G2QG42_THET4|nr:glycoside hydrolase family 13 protein [Thermothelomyces thermophilus ATCC 42464]AEO58507.1 glycoside hydrolase family 13 protein [Thermothelomyces thermophilus ATCC 42464]
MPALAALGVTKLWIPPACKAAAGPEGNGYDAYDLWDLGEFEQKGSRRTKWGTKEELVRMAEAARREGVAVLFDAVLNHKMGADRRERAVATRVEDRDRRVEVEAEVEGEEKREIGAWTGFEFPGRKGKYSGMRWSKEHFTGVDYDDLKGEKGVWKFEGKEWAEDVDEELGNYDFLLAADIDHRHPEVRADLFRWIEWLPSQVQLGGLRLDAIKHYSFSFLRDFVAHVRQRVGQGWFIVGEYWREDSEYLAKFIEFMDHQISLFDVQLVSNFSKVSVLEEKGDLREILDDTLALWKPENAVTPIAPFFIPFAYAIILLRANCGLPCVFFADLFGSVRQDAQSDFASFVPPTSGGAILPKMMLARRFWAYGSQYDYFDDPHCVGFTRVGHSSQCGGHGLAVVMTNAWEYASKRMFVGKQHAGEIWTDLLKWCPGRIIIDEDGWGVFPVGHRSVAVWVNTRAVGREVADTFALH